MEEKLSGIFANKTFKVGIIEFYSKESNGKKIAFTGKCECGNIIKREKSYISACIKKNRIMNCGCKNLSYNTGISNRHWKGIGEISYKKFNHIKDQCKRAKKIKFLITIEEMWELFINQNKQCALTGRNLTMIDSNAKKIYSTASLDRIDSSKDYTIDNVWWIHKDINLMKNNLSLERILTIAKLVSENN